MWRAGAFLLAACAFAGTIACDRSSVGDTPPTNGGTSGDASPCPQPHCPEVLYDRSQSGGPRRGVAVDETDIYWCELTAAEGNVVRAAPKDGRGPVRTLGSWTDFGASASLTADGANTYWLRSDGPGSFSLVRTPKIAGAAVSIPLPNGNGALDLGPLHDEGSAIIVGEHGCGHVVRVPKIDGAPTIWAVSPYPDAGGVTGLEASGQTIYCASGERIFALDTSVGGVRELVAGQTSAGPVILDAGSLYFVNNRGDATNRQGDLRILSGDENTPGELGEARGNVSRLLLDPERSAIHWVTGLSASAARVLVYQVDGAKPPAILFENQDVMGSSASDADYLYWLSEHAVTRLKKWP